MQLSDFEHGAIPGQLYGFKADLRPIEDLLRQGLIHAPGVERPVVKLDMFYLTPLGRQKLDGIDVSRLPYKRGQDAYHGGLARTWHETADANKHGTLTIGSGSHRHWVAGWDAAKKAEEAK